MNHELNDAVNWGNQHAEGYGVAQNALAQARQEMAIMRHDLDEETQQLLHLHQEKTELTKNLESCKDRIFSMQPTEGMADTQLRDKYAHVCSSVEYWVEGRFSETEGIMRRLLKVEAGSRSLNIARLHRNPETLEAIQKNPEVEITVLQGLVSRYLHDKLFESDRVFPGMDHNAKGLLTQIEEKMKSFKPAKGKIIIRTVESDADNFRTSSRPDVASRYAPNPNP